MELESWNMGVLMLVPGPGTVYGTYKYVRNIQVCSVQIRGSRVGKIFGRLKKFSNFFPKKFQL